MGVDPGHRAGSRIHLGDGIVIGQGLGTGRVTIADTTIRDEHLLTSDPRLLADRELADVWRSCALGIEERLTVVRRLSELGVDVIEAGFAEVPESLAAVRAVAEELEQDGPVVAVLASAHSGGDILQAAVEAVSKAGRRRVHVHVKTSDLLDADGDFRRHPALLLDEALGTIERARAEIEDVEFSPPQTSLEAVKIAADWARGAIECGVKTINVRYCPEGPDPDDFLALLAELRRLVAPPSDVVLSADLFAPGLRGIDAYVAATGCAEAALEAGCRQVKCAFHGVAATPGHPSLEMIAFQTWLREYLGESHLWTAVETRRLLAAAESIAAAKGLDTPPTQPLLGANTTSPHPSDFPEDPLERALTASATQIVLRGLGLPIPEWLDEFTHLDRPDEGDAR